ncbi:tyrosine-type recombinase/integrase [Oceaniradius stylonematis]|uniref:tyrosine-type recombinase/integrase n=1 Tax=Oceaniradius stylonematis TaxID=2184161 RepID=UPI00273FC3BC|nr:site-specific integrase [Oceaniradius stylonematis]
MSDLWAGYVADMAGRRILERMEFSAKAILPTFGHLEADQVTVDQCRKHTDRRRKQGVGNGTIHTELGHLSNVLSWAHKRRLIKHRVHIERPAPPDSPDVYVTREEVRRMLACDLAPHITVAIHLLIGTGARKEAALQLTWAQVNFDIGLIDLRRIDEIRRKGRATVPMTNTLRAVLQTAKEAALTPHVVEYAGRPVKNIRRGLARAGTLIGRDDITAHVFRRSAARWMAEDGVPMDQIAQFLGHSDSRITERKYARFSPTHLRGAATALEI